MLFGLNRVKCQLFAGKPNIPMAFSEPIGSCPIAEVTGFPSVKIFTAGFHFP
jgi:hypothetical protein